jgi:hypothetical protein
MDEKDPLLIFWPDALLPYIRWIVDSHIADVAGLVSTLGLVVAIWKAIAAARSAKRAELAADVMRQSLKLYDAVSGFSEAVTLIEDMKRVQRAGQILLLPERCTSLRKILISARAGNSGLSDKNLQIIQRCLTTLIDIEAKVEKHLQDKNKLDRARLNSFLARDADGLLEVLEELKAAAVGVTNGNR